MPYSSVIIAAIIPAVAYFFCLFLSVVFQARKQKITAVGEITDDMILNRQDYLNLIMIFGPILLILALLLTPKDSVGCGLLGGLLGAERQFTNAGCKVDSLSWILQAIQNSAGSAGAAGWWAVMLLIVLLFVDPEVRARPRKIIDGMAQAGGLISTLYLMFLAVSIIDFCLSFTGLPVFLALDVLAWLNSLDLGGGGSVFVQFLALLMTMFLAVLLGMGMPAVPAYINAALLMGPVLAGLGLSLFTAHMFIFYFAVASAITPPVALAAFAAATITKAEPMATGFSAVKSGIVIFVVPFIFAFYPELLLITDAILDPQATGGNAYLPGYDGSSMIGSRRVGTMDCSIAPLTEPDMRTTHPALWIGPSKCQLKLGRYLRGVKFLPSGFQRDQSSCEPGNRIGPRHARTVGLVPDTPAAVRGAGGSPAARPHCQEMSEKEAGSLLLTHDDRSQPTADMSVEYTQSLDTLFRAKPEVSHPPVEVAAETRHTR